MNPIKGIESDLRPLIPFKGFIWNPIKGIESLYPNSLNHSIVALCECINMLDL